MNSFRYVIINIRNFLRDHRALFILMMTSEIISTICLLFSFGLFQNTRQQSGMMSDSDKFCCFDVLQDDSNEKLYKDNVKNKIIQFREFLGNDVDISQNSMNIYYRVFSNSGTEFAASSYYYEHNPSFTREELEKSKYLCDIHECYSDLIQDGAIELSGNKYKVTNIRNDEEALETIIIPVEGIPENAELTSVSFYLKEQPTKERINEINNMFDELFGISNSILPKAKLLMDVQINNMFYLYAALITIIIVLNLSLYFKYIFSVNKRKMRIFKICGATSKNVAAIFISETMLELIIGYIIGNGIFKFAALKKFSGYFNNIENYYSTKVYLITFLIFVSVSLIIVSIITVPYVNEVLNTNDRRKVNEN